MECLCWGQSVSDIFGAFQVYLGCSSGIWSLNSLSSRFWLKKARDETQGWLPSPADHFDSNSRCWSRILSTGFECFLPLEILLNFLLLLIFHTIWFDHVTPSPRPPRHYSSLYLPNFIALSLFLCVPCTCLLCKLFVLGYNTTEQVWSRLLWEWTVRPRGLG